MHASRLAIRSSAVMLGARVPVTATRGLVAPMQSSWSSAFPVAGHAAGFASGSDGNQTERPDFYRVLGVSHKASLDEIKIKYRELAKVHHPDAQHPEKDAEKFADITSAYEVLSDPAKRQMYDHDRLERLAALRMRNEGGAGYLHVAGDEMFRKGMLEAEGRAREQGTARGATNRANRPKIEIPTQSQTMWRMAYPAAVVGLYIFNYFFVHWVNQ